MLTSHSRAIQEMNSNHQPCPRILLSGPQRRSSRLACHRERRLQPRKKTVKSKTVEDKRPRTDSQIRKGLPYLNKPCRPESLSKTPASKRHRKPIQQLQPPASQQPRKLLQPYRSQLPEVVPNLGDSRHCRRADIASPTDRSSRPDRMFLSLAGG